MLCRILVLNISASQPLMIFILEVTFSLDLHQQLTIPRPNRTHARVLLLHCFCVRPITDTSSREHDVNRNVTPPWTTFLILSCQNMLAICHFYSYYKTLSHKEISQRWNFQTASLLYLQIVPWACYLFCKISTVQTQKTMVL